MDDPLVRDEFEHTRMGLVNRRITGIAKLERPRAGDIECSCYAVSRIPRVSGPSLTQLSEGRWRHDD